MLLRRQEGARRGGRSDRRGWQGWTMDQGRCTDALRSVDDCRFEAQEAVRRRRVACDTRPVAFVWRPRTTTMSKARPTAPVRLMPREIARRRARLVKLVERLPEAKATEAGGRHLSLEVRGKRFGWCLEDHHGDGRLAVNCKCPPDANKFLLTIAPDRFHVPKY